MYILIIFLYIVSLFLYVLFIIFLIYVFHKKVATQRSAHLEPQDALSLFNYVKW